MNPLERAALKSRWVGIPAGEKALLLLGILILVVSKGPLYGLVLIPIVGHMRPPLRLTAALIAAPTVFQLLGIIPLMFTFTNAGIAYLGYEKALEVFLRSVVATAATVLFALSTPLPQTIGLLQRLKVPADIIDIMVSMYRMTVLLIATAHTIWQAQAARLGYSNRRLWIFSVAGLAASLFIKSIDRARRFKEGMELRGIESFPVDHRPAKWTHILAITVFLVTLGVL